MIKKTNLALLVGTNSWRDQFIEAITVSAGKYKESDREREKERKIERERERKIEREREFLFNALRECREP